MASIVGRSEELAAIERALSRLGEGESSLLGIAGDPGIGKSRLLFELRERAAAEGHLVLDGRAAEFERDLPFSVFRDALEAYLASLEPRRLELRGIGDLEALAAIFPSLGEADEIEPVERHRSHRAISGLLSGLATGRGVVLVLDDLHWADAASLELLLALSRRPAGGGVLVAFAYRPQPSVDALHDATQLAAAAEQGFLLEPKPLDDEDANALVPTGLADGIRSEVLAAAGGNPFYLEQLVRSPAGLDGEGGAEVLEGGFDLPAAIAASMSDELRALDADVVRLLEGAAIAGDPFALALAAEIAEIDHGSSLELIDRAIDAAVVRPTQTPGRFTFRHPLLRRAVHSGSGEGWRLAAHGRAASALHAQGAAAAERAHHVAASARPGDAAAAALLREAAASAVDRAPLSAANWLGSALGLVGDGDLELRRELLVELGQAQLAGGLLEEAERSVEQAVALSGSDVEPDLIVDLAEVYRWTGGVAKAIAQLEALAERETLEPETDARLQLRLLYLCRFSGELHKAHENGRRALAGAERTGDPLAVAFARAAAVEVAANFDVEGARDSYAELTAIVAGLPGLDRAGAATIDALYSLGWAATHLELYDESIAHFRRALDLARRVGSVRHMAALRSDLVEPMIRAGRVEAALLQADEAVEAARLLSHPLYLWYPLWTQSAAATRGGHSDLAEVAFAEAEEVASGGMVQPMSSMLMSYQRASMLSQRGDGTAAVAALIAAHGSLDLWFVPLGVRWRSWEIRVAAALADGNLELAESAVTEAEEATVGSTLRVPSAAAARMRSIVERERGRVDDAVVAARRSVELTAEVGAALEAERSRAVLANALLAAGDREAAIAELIAVESRFAELGADDDRAAAARELRRLGRRAPIRSTASPGSGSGELSDLSGRELEVAELVAEQLTNREIAERLFLSEKTVESHLRNAFAKLGVSSRVAVAQAVERTRLTE